MIFLLLHILTATGIIFSYQLFEMCWFFHWKTKTKMCRFLKGLFLTKTKHIERLHKLSWVKICIWFWISDKIPLKNHPQTHPGRASFFVSIEILEFLCYILIKTRKACIYCEYFHWKVCLAIIFAFSHFCVWVTVTFIYGLLLNLIEAIRVK